MGADPQVLRFAGGSVVLPDEVVDTSITVAEGLIQSLGTEDLGDFIDLEGDYLLPGLVEVHTDNLERHLEPRPGVFWDPPAAVIAHDLELAGSGIVTALDAVCIGDMVPGGFRARLGQRSVDAIRMAATSNLLRADHQLHLRCELSDPEAAFLFADVVSGPLVHLVSLMDHTPGQRQWRDLAVYRKAYNAKHGLSEEALDRLIVERQAGQARCAPVNRERILDIARAQGFCLASHDDSEPGHVDEAVEAGMTICEFPTTAETAKAAHLAKMRVVVGAPNVLRGGSHSGNVSALEVITAGDADILSSDYYPASLLAALFDLKRRGMPLAQAVALATSGPAEALGLEDRGKIMPGRRADLLRVRETPVGPVVVAAWKMGTRIV